MTKGKNLDIYNVGGAFIAALIIAALLPFLVMVCWNYVMPIIFSLPRITYWQSFVLYIMTQILFNQTNFKSDANK